MSRSEIDIGVELSAELNSQRPLPRTVLRLTRELVLRMLEERGFPAWVCERQSTRAIEGAIFRLRALLKDRAIKPEERMEKWVESLKRRLWDMADENHRAIEHLTRSGLTPRN